MNDQVLIRNLKAAAYTIPTDTHEADGTIEWDSTTIIIVELEGGGKKGLGYTYAHVATLEVIEKTLKKSVIGKDIMQLPDITAAMIKSIRNEGNCGIAMMAVSAVDNALWDLKARILNISVASLLGTVRNEVLVYGSGGFTSYSNKQLEKQLGSWAASGMKHVKMKIGTHIEKDLERVQAAREVLGPEVELYVDANGAYTARQAVEMAQQFSDYKVTWFEEPVPSDDLKGLNFIRNNVPKGMAVAAGEYGYNVPYFEKMLEAEAVDILQADATRCGGISGILHTDDLCLGHQLPFSSHCAPALHAQVAMTLNSFFIAEYFYDHARIEDMLLDGVPALKKGFLKPDLSRPGMGFDFKYKNAAKYLVK